VYLYLSPEPCSLDAIGEDLGLSKAAISVAASQLETLGFLRRVWKKGDRKCYYRTADDIASALHHGLLVMIRGKMLTLGDELRFAQSALKKGKADARAQFILKRVERAEKLRSTASKVLESPLLKLFVR
jgi:DNA-binding transcriptional regulator GbsR (MarR family)